MRFRTAEQAAGILVGCLPVLPAFFRAYIRPVTSKNSGSGELGGKHIRGGDPYLLMKDSKEEVDMESGVGVAVGTDGGWGAVGGHNSHGEWRTGTTTTINAGRTGKADDEGDGASLSQIESLDRDRVAVVWKSVRVDRR